jgi:hypothetical protein
MKRAARLAVVALIAGLAVGPVVLDACLFACQTGHDLSLLPASPACHHTSGSAGVHLKGPARSCSHDHHATAATMTPVDHAARGLRAADRDAGLIVPSNIPSHDNSFAYAISLALRAAGDRTPAAVTPLRV